MNIKPNGEERDGKVTKKMTGNFYAVTVNGKSVIAKSAGAQYCEEEWVNMIFAQGNDVGTIVSKSGRKVEQVARRITL